MIVSWTDHLAPSSVQVVEGLCVAIGITRLHTHGASDEISHDRARVCRCRCGDVIKIVFVVARHDAYGQVQPSSLADVCTTDSDMVA